MSEVKWIKITTNIFDDEKIQLIESMPDSDTIIVIWFKLLSLAGKSNSGGLVMINEKVPYTKEMLTTLFRRKQSVVELALLTFENFGMIEILDNDAILISNWEKHQSVKSLEDLKEQNRIRQQRFREKQKLLLNNSNINNIKDNKKQDIDKELDIDKESHVISNVTDNVTPKKPKKRFVKPTVDEIREYCLERKNNIDAQKFFDYNESKGWVIGKNAPMKDWKAAVRTWESNNKKQLQPQPQNNLSLEERAKRLQERYGVE